MYDGPADSQFVYRAPHHRPAGTSQSGRAVGHQPGGDRVRHAFACSCSGSRAGALQIAFPLEPHATPARHARAVSLALSPVSSSGGRALSGCMQAPSGRLPAVGGPNAAGTFPRWLMSETCSTPAHQTMGELSLADPAPRPASRGWAVRGGWSSFKPKWNLSKFHMERSTPSGEGHPPLAAKGSFILPSLQSSSLAGDPTHALQAGKRITPASPVFPERAATEPNRQHGTGQDLVCLPTQGGSESRRAIARASLTARGLTGTAGSAWHRQSPAER